MILLYHLNIYLYQHHHIIAVLLQLILSSIFFLINYYTYTYDDSA